MTEWIDLENEGAELPDDGDNVLVTYGCGEHEEVAVAEFVSGWFYFKNGAYSRTQLAPKYRASVGDGNAYRVLAWSRFDKF